MEERKLCPLCYYTNCVSTTLTVLNYITLKVSISLIVTLYILLSEWRSSVFDSKLLVRRVYVLVQFSMYRVIHNLKMWCLRQKY